MKNADTGDKRILFQVCRAMEDNYRDGKMSKRKVTLKYLQTSKDPTAIEFRNIVGQSVPACPLCCMFLEADYTDDDDNTSTCHFEEIDPSELEHFQQLADYCVEEIKIVSLEGKAEPQKEKVNFD